jgi:hypothetical protein
MNPTQRKDSEKCEQMAEQGKDMDCLGCSCNVCIANYGLDQKLEYVKGRLEDILGVIEFKESKTVPSKDLKEYIETTLKQLR